MKPVTLDDLSRAELLRLLRNRFLFLGRVTEHDMIQAQWEEAVSRLDPLGKAVRDAIRERNIAWDAVYVDRPTDRATEIKRLQILQAAEKAERIADRNYKACQTRCDRLNKQYEAATKTRRSSHA